MRWREKEEGRGRKKWSGKKREGRGGEKRECDGRGGRGSVAYRFSLI